MCTTTNCSASFSSRKTAASLQSTYSKCVVLDGVNVTINCADTCIEVDRSCQHPMYMNLTKRYPSCQAPPFCDGALAGDACGCRGPG